MQAFFLTPLHSTLTQLSVPEINWSAKSAFVFFDIRSIWSYMNSATSPSRVLMPRLQNPHAFLRRLVPSMTAEPSAEVWATLCMTKQSLQIVDSAHLQWIRSCVFPPTHMVKGGRRGGVSTPIRCSASWACDCKSCIVPLLSQWLYKTMFGNTETNVPQCDFNATQ